MKPLTILVLWTLLVLPLQAQDQLSADSAAWLRFTKLAQEQMKLSRFAEAAESGKEALRVAKHFGPLDRKLGSTYHLLGIIYRDWGHCAEARGNYVRAIAIWQRQPEPTPRYIFNAITNLVSVVCECDDFPGAEKLFKTYQADLQRYRSDTLDDAKMMSLRAVLARGRKDYARSEALFRQSLALMEKVPNVSPIELEVERSSLAVVLDKQGRHAESLAESQHAIAFLEHAAPLHPSLLAAINNAACSLADLGRGEESARMFQRALDLGRELYGEDNRVIAKIMLSYARVLRENKETPAAADYQKRGVEAFRRSLTRDRSTVDVEELRK